ncbi:MAG: hypothetical protein AB1626_01270 [Candidatus Micrarchaeota archaeon]
MAKKGLNVGRTALALSITFAALYLLWALVVAGTMGGALGYGMGLHMMVVPYAYAGFSFFMLFYGLVAAFVAGAVVGGVFAAVWNGLSE